MLIFAGARLTELLTFLYNLLHFKKKLISSRRIETRFFNFISYFCGFSRDTGAPVRLETRRCTVRTETACPWRGSAGRGCRARRERRRPSRSACTWTAAPRSAGGCVCAGCWRQWRPWGVNEHSTLRTLKQLKDKNIYNFFQLHKLFYYKIIAVCYYLCEDDYL